MTSFPFLKKCFATGKLLFDGKFIIVNGMGVLSKNLSWQLRKCKGVPKLLTKIAVRPTTLSRVLKVHLSFPALMSSTVTMTDKEWWQSSKSCIKSHDKILIILIFIPSIKDMSKVTNIIKWWFDTHIWNLLQDLGAQDALKTLQTKLESPIAVTNKPRKLILPH